MFFPALSENLFGGVDHPPCASPGLIPIPTLRQQTGPSLTRLWPATPRQRPGLIYRSGGKMITIFCSVEILFSQSLKIAMVTPSLPQRGRHPKGASPLDPVQWNFQVRSRRAIHGHAPRGEGRQTPNARGPITIQNDSLGFLQSTSFMLPGPGRKRQRQP
jgi:hypothetical protein